MKKYTIDISMYPKSYEIQAETKEKAIEQARMFFAEDTNGASIWEVEITGEEDSGFDDELLESSDKQLAEGEHPHDCGCAICQTDLLANE